ncbi:MAG TPA: Gfo/Idh/MocA family oxidoreductase, partial [Ramlibacter sp.]|uniref:NAD(P)H-dependent oxidoreductase n=1 Tax=Ramlibacter sp. TaxID=1917967 RepID=UPI002D7F2A78
MSLHAKLQQRQAEGKPIRVGLIGAGKFGSMYLAQVPNTPGVHLAAIADLAPANARANLERVGWKAQRTEAASIDEALKTGATHVGDDWQALVRHPAIDVVVECTGHPIAAVDHCLEAFAHRKHVVNVTVEADAFCGPLLARKAADAGVVYSLAFGDQPALICDLVDWARTCGFPVVAAGRGHKWLPHFSESTPDTVWDNWGLTREQAQRGGLNPKMFNSFLDGSKPAIESTAVANATGLAVPSDGLLYPPASIEDIPFVTRPRSEGGVLERKGMVEVISSLESDGRAIPYEIRMGVWVTVEGETEYIRNCFEEYKAHTDPSGRYFTLYKRWHLIGLE